MRKMKKVNGEKEKCSRRKKDGRRWAANATIAFSGLAEENFHHRLFFASYQCRVSTQFQSLYVPTIDIDAYNKFYT